MPILPLPLIQEEQLSVTGERMCTKYCFDVKFSMPLYAKLCEVSSDGWKKSEGSFATNLDIVG